MPSIPRKIGHEFGRVARALLVSVFWLVLAFATLVSARAIFNSANISALAAIYVAMLAVLVLKLVFITIHEFGHAGMAAVLGWRVSMLVVGPLAIKLDPLQIIAGTPIGGRWLSGGTYVAPPVNDRPPMEFVAISLAGPAVNLASGFLIVACARWFGARDLAHSPAEIFGLLSVFMGIWSLLPIGSRSGSPTDGGNILDVLRGADLETRANLQRVYDAIIRGVRPRDWDRILVAFLIEKSKTLQRPQESMLLYIYHFDRGDFANARVSLDQAISVRGSTDSLLVCDAFFSAFAEKNLAYARASLSKVKVRRGGYFSTAEAVVKVCEGDVAGATRSARIARRALRKWPFATACDWDILDQIDVMIRNAAVVKAGRSDNSVAEYA
jgi:hypothetical protein